MCYNFPHRCSIDSIFKFCRLDGISLYWFSCSLPATGWIRVGGTLASLFGFYYIGAGLDDMEGRFPLRFYQVTILGRIFLSIVFALLVVTKQSPRGLLLLSVVNILSAGAMARQVSATSARVD